MGVSRSSRILDVKATVQETCNAVHKCTITYLRDKHNDAAASCDGKKWQKSYSGSDNSIKYFDKV